MVPLLGGLSKIDTHCRTSRGRGLPSGPLYKNNQIGTIDPKIVPNNREKAKLFNFMITCGSRQPVFKTLIRVSAVCQMNLKQKQFDKKRANFNNFSLDTVPLGLSVHPVAYAGRRFSLSPKHVDLLSGCFFLLLKDLLWRALNRLGCRHHVLLQYLVVRRLVSWSKRIKICNL